MNRVLSDALFVNHRLSIAWLNRVMQAGIPAVEIFCARQHLDYRNRGCKSTNWVTWFKDSELKLHSLHAPMYSDEIWGRSGPHSVITITEPVKGQRIQDGGRNQARRSNRGVFRSVPDPAPGVSESFHERKVDAAFSALGN